MTEKPEGIRRGIVEFGRYKIIPAKREAFADGKPMQFGDRAFDVLMRLIEAQGALMTKDELMKAVWPGQIVEENALQAHISALRRAFGADRDFIRTVAGRGYQFLAEVRTRTPAVFSPGASGSGQQPVSELIGRDNQLRDLLDALTRQRLVSLCGPGGIGKTRLGLEAARQLRARFSGRICVTRLAPLMDGQLVVATVANTLGIALAGGRVTVERIAAALGTDPVLLVLDNCEHVIDECARLTEALLHHAPSARLLITSREPLRVDSEFVYRVPGLDTPADKAAPGDLKRSGAIRLFMARVLESDPGFAPDDAALSTIASICRQLDGIPLALELAAGRAAALGIHGLSARLEDRFRILTGGKRTALPRHQTLRATLDWSYELLPESERLLLRRFAVFSGQVTLDVAARVIADDRVAEADVIDGIANLVSKSLVIRDAASETYRLLETTRAYAREKLSDAGELEMFARRHAEQYRDLFQQAELDWETQPTAQWLAAYEPHLDNLRVALDWQFAAKGDESMAIQLTVSAVPLWFELSLIDECNMRVERALALLPAASGVPEKRIMQLHAAHGWTLQYTTAPARETGIAWSTALQLAEQLGNTDHRIRALWGMWCGDCFSGQMAKALGSAKKFCEAAQASSDPSDALVGTRMMAYSQHFLGNQDQALALSERMLAQYEPPQSRSHVVRFQFHQGVVARMVLARILWLQGKTDQARRNAEVAVQEAQSLNHRLSLGNVLAQSACPVALLAGELDLAERYLTMLEVETAASSLGAWRLYSHGYRGMLGIQRGDVAAGVRQLTEVVNGLRRANYVPYLPAFLLAQAEALVAADRADEALRSVDDGLESAERGKNRWCTAELLRVRGEVVLRQGGPASEAGQCFERAIEWARDQGALSWQLRAATSLARLRQTQGRLAQGKEVLAPVLAKFTEGLGSRDVRSARELLRTLE